MRRTSSLFLGFVAAGRLLRPLGAAFAAGTHGGGRPGPRLCVVGPVGSVVNGTGLRRNGVGGDISSVADPGFGVAEAQGGGTTTTGPPPLTTPTLSTVTTTTLAPAGDSWPRRFFDAQNTADVGDD